MENDLKTQTDYNITHPWHYVLGGSVPTLKQILAEVKAANYRGCSVERIDAASRKPEPQRSEALRVIKARVTEELRCDLSSYRQYVCKLYSHRRGEASSGQICDDIHVSMSLKCAHIYNDLAHLNVLDNLPAQQKDLFDI